MEQPLFTLYAPSKVRIPSLLLPRQSTNHLICLLAKINHLLPEASTKRLSFELHSLNLHSVLIFSTDATAFAVRQLGSSFLLLSAVPGQMNLPKPSLHSGREEYTDTNSLYLTITPLTVGVTVAFPSLVGCF